VGLIAGVVWIGAAEVEEILVELVVTMLRVEDWPVLRVLSVEDWLVDEEATCLAWVEELLDLELVSCWPLNFVEVEAIDDIKEYQRGERLNVDFSDEVEEYTNAELELVTTAVLSM
jgi:hypothetical protein